jgi:hypothetical protein
MSSILGSKLLTRPTFDSNRQGDPFVLHRSKNRHLNYNHCSQKIFKKRINWQKTTGSFKKTSVCLNRITGNRRLSESEVRSTGPGGYQYNLIPVQHGSDECRPLRRILHVRSSPVRRSPCPLRFRRVDPQLHRRRGSAVDLSAEEFVGGCRLRSIHNTAALQQ